MSKENVELHRRAFDAWNRRDLDALLGLADPNIEFTPLNVEMEGGHPYRGHEGARRFWEDSLTIFPDLRIEVDAMRDLGAVTVAAVRLRGHGAGSNIPVEQPAWQVVRWRNKKIVGWRDYLTEAEALEAAGLQE